MHVYSYEQALEDHKSIVAHFAKTQAIDLKEPARANQSANPLQIALLAKLNEVGFNTTHQGRYALRERIRPKILELSTPEAPYEKTDKRYYQSLLEDDVQEECQWLRDEIGIDYSVPERADVEPLRSYFDKILAASGDQLRQLFSEFGVQYAQGDKIQKKFFEVVFEMVTGLRFADFDAEEYLVLNPDVKTAKMDPHTHYYTFGFKNGRRTK
ncbi:MAG: hypothetical protein AAF641_00300 [Pseudomonadota bacterium]